MQPDHPVLRVLESRRADGTLVVSVEGEVDLATAPTLARQFERIFDRADTVLVDLRRVHFLDCVGLRELLCLHEDGLERGCRVGFVQGPESVRRVFELTGTLSRLSFAEAA